MKKGDFVFIDTVDKEIGKMYPIQGVYVGNNIDGTVQIQGVRNTVYRGIGDGIVVPDHNIWNYRKEIEEIRKTI